MAFTVGAPAADRQAADEALGDDHALGVSAGRQTSFRQSLLPSAQALEVGRVGRPERVRTPSTAAYPITRGGPRSLAPGASQGLGQRQLGGLGLPRSQTSTTRCPSGGQRAEVRGAHVKAR